MEIQEERRDGALILHITSQIDSTTGPILGDRLDQAMEEGHVQLVLDLAEVPYISSAGLRVLSVALKAVRAPDKRGDLLLAGMSNTVGHAFRISGFNQVFSIYDTVSEALIALAESKKFG